MSKVKSKKTSKKATTPKKEVEDAVQDDSRPCVWICKVSVKYRGINYKAGQTVIVPPHQVGPELEKYFKRAETEIIKIVSDPAHLIKGDNHAD